MSETPEHLLVQITHLPGDGGPASVRQIVLEAKDSAHGVSIETRPLLENTRSSRTSLPPVESAEVKIVLRGVSSVTSPTWMWLFTQPEKSNER